MSDTIRARASRGNPILSFVIDVAIVVFFAVYGRLSHGLHIDFVEFLDVAWPFLAGLIVSWLAALVWRHPTSMLRAGLPVWIGTLVIGMLLRYFVAGGGASPVFILVAGILFAILFIGWRGIATLVRRRRLTKA